MLSDAATRSGVAHVGTVVWPAAASATAADFTDLKLIITN